MNDQNWRKFVKKELLLPLTWRRELSDSGARVTQQSAQSQSRALGQRFQTITALFRTNSNESSSYSLEKHSKVQQAYKYIFQHVQSLA